ncbi:unnamed protein product, partial [Ilex paraguariensis]
MAFNHRKLVQDFCNNTIKQFCGTNYCDPSKNENGACPLSCISCCYPICYRPLGPVSDPKPTWNDPPNPPHRLSLLFIIGLAILAATFFLFSCFLIYKIYTGWFRCRRRSQPQEEEIHDDFLDEDHGPVVDHHIWYIRTVGLQPSVISAITICKYKRGDGLVEGTECSVCLSEFEEDETLRLLPKCSHAFHIRCIDTWLRSHTNCPLCRAGIVINAAESRPLEQSVNNSGVAEETQLGISENNNELAGDGEEEACELRNRIEEEGESQVENRIKIEENSKGEVDEVQPLRRSVSVDSLTASMISLAVASAHSSQSNGNSDSQVVKINETNMEIVPKNFGVNMRLVGSPSIGRSLQKGPRPIKRSFSYSGT